MDHPFTPEEAERHDAAVRFARAALAGRDALALDREERFDREAWDRCASFGLRALPAPEEHGGFGAPHGADGGKRADS